MDCCGQHHCHGHALTRRQWIWSTVLSSIGAILSGGVGPHGSTAAAQTAETTSAAADITAFVATILDIAALRQIIQAHGFASLPSLAR